MTRFDCFRSFSGNILVKSWNFIDPDLATSFAASMNQALVDFNKAKDVPYKEETHLEDWKVKRSTFKRKSTSTSF